MKTRTTTTTYQPWLKEVLSHLQGLSFPLYLSGEVVYKHFFNGHRGPILNQVEVKVISHEDKETLHGMLTAFHPHIRWIVVQVDGDEQDVLNYLKTQPLTCLTAALKVQQGVTSFLFGHEDAQQHLEEGKVEPTAFYDQKDEEFVYFLSSLYPGLSSDAFTLQSLYEEMDEEEIDEYIHEHEHGGRICRDTLSEQEKDVKERILAWHKAHPKTKLMVPIPGRSTLPSGDPWESSDAEFREWMVQQTLVPNATIEKDPYLHYVLNLQRVGNQKPTHEGWEIYHHSIMSVLQLKADAFEPSIRKCLRLTMIWHDFGKIKNVWTPSAHGAIGSKTWDPPSWVDEHEEKLIRFLIKTHDYFGLMDRWLQDPDFKGGCSPRSIKQSLNALDLDPAFLLSLMKEVYDADIGSVARLRCFLPLTPLLDELMFVEPLTVEG